MERGRKKYRAPTPLNGAVTVEKSSIQFGCRVSPFSQEPPSLFVWGVYDASSAPFRELLLLSLRSVGSLELMRTSVCLQRVEMFTPVKACASVFWPLLLSAAHS